MDRVVGALIPIVAIVGGITFVIVKVLVASRVRELEIRERIAMIEKGLVPSPEKDPAGFDRAMSRYDRYESRGYRGPGRHRRVGIILMGVGFGSMLLIGFADEVRHGLGVGGFLVIL